MDILIIKLNDIMSLKVIIYLMFILNNWIWLKNDWKWFVVLCIKNYNLLCNISIWEGVLLI